jgi:hypothetical protein
MTLLYLFNDFILYIQIFFRLYFPPQCQMDALMPQDVQIDQMYYFRHQIMPHIL